MINRIYLLSIKNFLRRKLYRLEKLLMMQSKKKKQENVMEMNGILQRLESYTTNLIDPLSIQERRKPKSLVILAPKTRMVMM
ncbi:Px protein [Almendravirus balsa]|uniref:Px protein n=1 Tax=Almendravirus balsa TaxID=1972684 RepID=UPI001E281B3A|nr:Px protein [Almendravirus balsa]